MSDINITALIAQMPYVQTLAHAQSVHPEAQQLFAAQMAQQVFKQQHEQVQKVDKQEQPQAVRKDKDERGGQGGRQGQARRQAAPAVEEEPTTQAGDSPWLGHLVNKKV